MKKIKFDNAPSMTALTVEMCITGPSMISDTEMLKKILNGESIELLPAPGNGYRYILNEDGTILKVPVAGVIYE
jgi:hypothetical protein